MSPKKNWDPKKKSPKISTLEGLFFLSVTPTFLGVRRNSLPGIPGEVPGIPGIFPWRRGTR